MIAGNTDSTSLFAVLFGIKGLSGKYTNAVRIGNEQDRRSRGGRDVQTAGDDAGQFGFGAFVRYWADGGEGREGGLVCRRLPASRPDKEMRLTA